MPDWSTSVHAGDESKRRAVRGAVRARAGYPVAMRALLIAASLLLITSAASSQAILRTIDLGEGIVVEAVSTPTVCIYTAGPCFLWHARGLDIARRDALLIARTYARVWSTPRIVAAVPYVSGRGYAAFTYGSPGYGRPGILYTDDQGATWSAARWTSRNVPTAMAFGADGALGMAVGASQGIWISTDHGERWIERSSSAGLSYVDVAVTGNVAVIVDERGNAWRTRDRGFALDTVGAEVNGPLSVVGSDIVVPTAHRTYRVGSDGVIRR